MGLSLIFLTLPSQITTALVDCKTLTHTHACHNCDTGHVAHFRIRHTNIFLLISARPKLASAATDIHQLCLAGFAAPLTHLFVQQEPQDSGVPNCAACVRLSVAPGHLFLTILFTWVFPLMQLHAFPKHWHRAMLEPSQLNQVIPSRG